MFTKFRILTLMIALFSLLGLISACSDSKSGTLNPPAPLNKNFVGVFVFDDYVLALNGEGELVAWGANDKGQTGVGSTAEVISTPTKVKLPEGVTRFISTGGIFKRGSTIFRGSDGNYYGWGANNNGVLGVGEDSIVIEPKKLVYPPEVEYFSDIKFSGNVAYAIGSDGKYYIWGSNAEGLLGVGSTEASVNVPTQLVYPAGVDSFSNIKFSGNVAYAIGSDNKHYIWGSNAEGLLGIGSTEASVNVPTQMVYPAGVESFSYLSFTDTNGFALGNDNRTYAWGSNVNGKTGTGSLESSLNKPTLISPVDDEYDFFSNIFTDGNGFLIGVGATGNISDYTETNYFAWGDNSEGKLGVDSNAASIGVPTKIKFDATENLGPLYQADNHTFMWSFDNQIYAWGSNIDGVLGINRPAGADNSANIPTQVVFPLDTGQLVYDSFLFSETAAYVFDDKDKLYAWGNNVNGFLGIGANDPNVTKPTLVEYPPNVTKLTIADVTDNNVMAFDSAGILYTWGDNRYGQLGIGSSEEFVSTPTRVLLPGIVTVVGGLLCNKSGDVIFAKGSDGKWYAWGRNDKNQLGVNLEGGRSFASKPILIN